MWRSYTKPENKQVALKFMEDKRSYGREVQFLQALAIGERYVVKFLGPAQLKKNSRKSPYCMVMECCAGNLAQAIYQELNASTKENLRTLLCRYDNSRWDETMKLRIMRDITLAVAYIHASGVIHCDLKPKNVLITLQGTIKLCDFGLAEWCPVDSPTVRAIRKGSTPYMAPEILHGDKGTLVPFTYGSDIFALAVSFNELMVEYPPYLGQPSGDTRPNLFVSNTPAGDMLRTIIQEMWQDEVTNRPSALVLAHVFDDIIHPESSR